MLNTNNQNQAITNQRVGTGLSQTNTLKTTPKVDQRGYPFFESKAHWHLLLPFLKCRLYISNDEITIRRYDIVGNFKETTLSRRDYSRINLRGHFDRYISLEFYYQNNYNYYYLPYLFTPADAYAIQQAFMFMRNY